MFRHAQTALKLKQLLSLAEEKSLSVELTGNLEMIS